MKPAKLWFWFSILVAWSASSLLAQACHGQEAGKKSNEDITVKFVQKYCVACHGERTQEGDRDFQGLHSLARTVKDSKAKDALHGREQWQEILDRLNLGDMPPEEAEIQPTDEERLKIIELLTKSLSQRIEKGESDQVSLLRLTKGEYDRTVRNLLGLETMLADPTATFSADQRTEGFENVGETLAVTDFLMKQYLSAADQYLDAAIIKASPAPEFRKVYNSPFFRERNPVDGMNVDGKYMHLRESSSGHGFYLWLEDLSRKGGVPASGNYKIRIKATALNRDHPYLDWIIDTSREDPMVMSIVGTVAGAKKPRFDHASDRELATFEVAEGDPKWHEADVWLDKGYMVKLGYPNGPRRIKYMRHALMDNHRDSFKDFLGDHVHVFHNMHPDFDKEKAPALVEKFLAEQDELKKAGKPYDLYGVDHRLHTDIAWKTFYREYKGPRIRVFEVQILGPVQADPPELVKPLIDSEVSDQDARRWIVAFANRAARKPLSAEKIEPILSLFESARKTMGVNQAARVAFKAVLCSPDFIYHRTRAGKLDPYELANRLSYFLTGLPADNTLLQLAAKGEIENPEVLRQQTERLLGLNSNRIFISDFLDSWLKLSKLGTMQPDENEHTIYFNDRLESAMREETILFLQEALEKDRPVQWLIDGDRTFVNGALARLYGMPGIEGHEMRQVKINDRLRGGLLGQASVLTATANGIDTSPVTRGVWVLESLLGTPPSPPPPDIEPLEPDVRGAVSIRDQLSKHRENVSCRHCHRRIDPLGFALESFDEIGRFRKDYGAWNKKAVPIETAGKLPSGEEFADLGELRQLVVKQSALVEKNFVTKLLVKATGRIDDPNDRADVMQILSRKDQGKNDAIGMKELLHQVISSEAFRR